MKQRYSRRYLFCCMLTLLALSLQACLDGDPQSNSSISEQVQVNTSQAARFQGKIYFTLDRNLSVLGGDGHLAQLTKNMDVRDPAVSPDGKWIAYVRRFKNYADLVYQATNPADQTVHIVITGKGSYQPGGDGENDFYWFAQPSWSADSQQLLFLSDLHKDYYWKHLGSPYANAPFLDLQVFSLPATASLTVQEAIEQARPIGYAVYGDGGNRDPSFRPHYPEQAIYTSYRYDAGGVRQVVQIMLIDVALMSGLQRWNYHPGQSPAIPLTPDRPDLVNFQPAFSPDGQAIAYIRRENATAMSLYVMPVATTIDQSSTFNPDNTASSKPAWEMYAKSTRLLTQSFISQPVWSPDGKHLLYYSYNENHFELWQLEVIRDAATDSYHLKTDSPILLVQAGKHLNADVRATISVS